MFALEPSDLGNGEFWAIFENMFGLMTTFGDVCDVGALLLVQGHGPKKSNSEDIDLTQGNRVHFFAEYLTSQ